MWFGGSSLLRLMYHFCTQMSNEVCDEIDVDDDDGDSDDDDDGGEDVGDMCSERQLYRCISKLWAVNFRID